MRNFFYPFVVWVICNTVSFGQNNVSGPVVRNPVYFDVSPPLRDMVKNLPKKAETSWKDGIVRNKTRPRNHNLDQPAGGLSDPGLQPMNGTTITDTTIVNFEGNSNTDGYLPPDTHGDVGLNDYFQVVNSHFSIYSKTGTLLIGPLANSSIWNGMSNNSNDGDAVVLYDEQADRWLFSQFSLPNYPSGPFYQMIAISQTNDPTGSWYRYQYSFTNMPDYPKFGIWPDAYYMSMHTFTAAGNYAGVGAVAYNRTLMLAGSPAATMIMFTLPTSNEAWGWLPSDCDGPFPSGNPPNYFIYPYDGTSNDHLGIYEFHVDWVTTSNSTFGNFVSLPVNAFTTNIAGIAQPGTTVLIDPINDRMMYRLQYRSFSDHAGLVCNHTVDVPGSVTGIRWYELRKTTGAWSIYQQGTYGPADNLNRWMGSIAQDSSGNIALGYSVGSSGTFPSIRYTGRKKNDANSQMTIAEKGIINGGGSQTYYDATRPSRWGDYSSLSCDPSAKATYWYTQEYYSSTSSGGWKTRIASFHFANVPTVVTTYASSITNTGGTLNATVNPNGLASTWHFEWGSTTAYGNSTSTLSAGSGSTVLAESSTLSGLTTGQIYHYRIDATNSEGTSNGYDMTFIPGGSVMTTTNATSITTTTASSGGNITADGGAAVGARGVCWSTIANPTTANSYTTDGSGIGSYTSSLTGLTANTTYHIRAYAINANGTWYGNDVFFTTACGIVILLPFTEDFESQASTPHCWTEGNANPAWQYLTGNGGTKPSSAHSGSLNACLKDVTTADNKNKLITPVFDLSAYYNLTLTFWHTQALWSPDQDQLRVFYKTSAVGSWVLLQTYTASITTWTQETINLPNIGSYYQIAFEGDARYGYGVCIDDIKITGPGIWVGGGLTGDPNAWNNIANWGDGVIPIATTDVYIPVRPNPPVITTTATCHNLVIERNAGVTINPTTITVNGTMTLK